MFICLYSILVVLRVINIQNCRACHSTPYIVLFSICCISLFVKRVFSDSGQVHGETGREGQIYYLSIPLICLNFEVDRSCL